MRKTGVLVVSIIFILSANLLFAGEGQEMALKVAAVEALGNIGEASSLDVLGRYLNCGEFLLEASVIEAIGKISNPKAVSMLKGKLASSRNRRIVVLAAGALSRQDKVAKSIFESAFIDKDSSVRAQAVQAAMVLSLGGSTDRLIAALEDRDTVVRLRAIEAVVKLAPENVEAISAIRKMLNDTNPDVRSMAVAFLGSYGGQEDVPVVRSMLSDKNMTVAASAKVALARLLGYFEAKVQEAKENVAKEGAIDKDSLLYATNLWVAAASKKITAIPRILSDIKEESTKTSLRVTAVSVLREFGRILKPALLEDLSKNESLNVYRDYVDLVFRIDNKTITEFFVDALSNKNSPYYSDAPLVLAAWEDRAAAPALLEASSGDGDIDFLTNVVYALGVLRVKPAAKNIERILIKK